MPLRNKLGIIGGSGLTSLAGLAVTGKELCDTPYGKPSATLVFGAYGGKEIIFLSRHGDPHTIPPHRVNYRANLWALQALGAATVIAVNAVGGITAEMQPERIVIPDQIIDYTWGRKHTFYEEDLEHVTHVDFTHPYTDSLRQKIINAAQHAGIALAASGTYGATQGPRLETAAEIRRMRNDGCDIVGMTGMPEAGLARELALDYASICLVVNLAAGTSAEIISMDVIEQHLARGMQQVIQILAAVIPFLDE